MDNRARFDEGCRHLRDALVPIVENTFQNHWGANWHEQLESARRGARADDYRPLPAIGASIDWDIADILAAMDLCWSLFRSSFPKQRTAKTPVLLLRDARNRWAHARQTNVAWFTDKNTIACLEAMGEILSALNAEQASKQVQHLIDELEDIRYRKRATERQSIENHLDQTPQKRPDFPPRISSVERSASTDGNITFVTIIDYRRLIEVSDEGDVFRFSKRQGSSPGEYQVAVARRSSNGHAISAFLLSIELGETALLCTSTGKHIRLVGERDGVRVADASGPGYDQLFRSLKTARAKSDDIAQYAEGVGAKWIDLTKEIQIQGEDDVVDLGGNSTPSTYALLGIAPYGMGRYTRYGYLVPVGREVLVNPVEGGPRRLVAFNGSIQIKEASGPSYWELLKEQVEKLRTRRSLERAMKRASRLAALKRTEPTE